MSAPPPLPPADLAARSPAIVKIAGGELIYRFYGKAHDPIYFDRSTSGRLNAPDGRFGVLYAAKSASGAFAETFLREPGRTLLPADMLATKALSLLRLTREIKLIGLTGAGLARVGATAQVPHGGLPYDAPQAWSAALHDHPQAVDGIAYMARHDDQELCIALFDRAAAAVEVADRRLTLDQDWFWDIADPYGVGLAP